MSERQWGQRRLHAAGSDDIQRRHAVAQRKNNRRKRTATNLSSPWKLDLFRLLPLSSGIDSGELMVILYSGMVRCVFAERRTELDPGAASMLTSDIATSAGIGLVRRRPQTVDTDEILECPPENVEEPYEERLLRLSENLCLVERDVLVATGHGFSGQKSNLENESAQCPFAGEAKNPQRGPPRIPRTRNPTWPKQGDKIRKRQ